MIAIIDRILCRLGRHDERETITFVDRHHTVFCIRPKCHTRGRYLREWTSSGAWPNDPATGAQLIAAERQRQIDQEGYDARHDHGHQLDLLRAAYSYANVAAAQLSTPRISWAALTATPTMWPWDRKYWKPDADIRRNTIKAGALIAAALDALPGAPDPEPRPEWPVVTLHARPTGGSIFTPCCRRPAFGIIADGDAFAAEPGLATCKGPSA